MKTTSHIFTFYGSNSSVSSVNTLSMPPKDEWIPKCFRLASRQRCRKGWNIAILVPCLQRLVLLGTTMAVKNCGNLWSQVSWHFARTRAKMRIRRCTRSSSPWLPQVKAKAVSCRSFTISQKKLLYWTQRSMANDFFNSRLPWKMAKNMIMPLTAIRRHYWHREWFGNC